MSAPAKPTRDVLLKSWEWRHLAYKYLNFEQGFAWAAAWDVLLDALLEAQPELAWTSEPVDV